MDIRKQVIHSVPDGFVLDRAVLLPRRGAWRAEAHGHHRRLEMWSQWYATADSGPAAVERLRHVLITREW